MVSGNGVHEDDLIHRIVEITRLRPRKIVHLVNEGALTDHSANKVNGEGSVVCVRAYNAVSSTHDGNTRA